MVLIAKSGVERLASGDAGGVGDAAEPSVVRRWPEWWSMEGGEEVKDSDIVWDQKVAV